MKKLFSIVLVLNFYVPSYAVDDGQAMSQCINLSLSVALNAYAASHTLNPIPTITIIKSDEPPSNGIDIMINFNNTTTYYLTASPINTLPGANLIGCSKAFITQIK